ncbi:hypothetical protein [Nocardia anaemiae]|uniref:hypothetical protein n=1 Tax=Nocardia anaemiae TaxID=263910 RepID=UPI0007A4266A|nr:hypothetical protein [Nocardia anaemiae]
MEVDYAQRGETCCRNETFGQLSWLDWQNQCRYLGTVPTGPKYETMLHEETPEPDETPEPVQFDQWFVVSTGDQDALLESFGMVDSRPVTMRQGIEVMNTWHNAGVAVTYFSPELDGWTLVSGYHLPGIDTSWEPLQTFLCDLSRRFGTACWYASDYGFDGWALAENGELTRLYAQGDLGRDEIGPPHRAEGDSWPFAPSSEELENWPMCDLATVAERTSLNPMTLGSHIRVRGHAVIAITEAENAKRLPADMMPN